MAPPALDGSIVCRLCLQVLSCLTEVLDQGQRGFLLTEDWDRLHNALEALPLDTEQMSLARQRLANIRRYLADGEHGAALYETRLLWPLVIVW